MLYALYVITVMVMLLCLAFAHDMRVLRTHSGICYCSNGRAVLVKKTCIDQGYSRLFFKFRSSTISKRGFAFSSMREL